MKKILTIILTICFLFILPGCNEDNPRYIEKGFWRYAIYNDNPLVCQEVYIYYHALQGEKFHHYKCADDLKVKIKK